MFAYHRRALLCPNLNPILRFKTLISSSLVLIQPFSTSPNPSFTINYLIQNLQFSPETASKLSTRINFTDSTKPDSVLALFKTYGFTNPQLSSIVKTRPNILSFDPNKTILPKLNFLLSKGASNSDLVHIVAKNPLFLSQSLKNTMTPCYNFVNKFLCSDELTMLSIKSCAAIIYSKYPAKNIQLLRQIGVPKSKIALILRHWPYTVIVNPPIFEKAVNEVKELGFKPKMTLFIVALRAKVIPKSLWEKKVDLFKKWGWSEDVIVSAFLKYPWCMLASVDKIETVMKYFVNHMGWDSLVLAKNPVLIMFSLEKRIIPRASVLQFLESEGLIKGVNKWILPFKATEKVFLERFVNCFEKESSQLLKLYKENTSIPT